MFLNGAKTTPPELRDQERKGVLWVYYQNREGFVISAGEGVMKYLKKYIYINV